jgi:predicted lipoprotein with Yx(FWY)xxD motif
MRKTYLAVGALALVAGLAIAGCGGSGGTASTAASGRHQPEATNGRSDVNAGSAPTAHASSATTTAVVEVKSTPQLGKVIVDAEGQTLYDFRKDEGMVYEFDRPPTSTCYEACAEAWPPLLTEGQPKAGDGANPSMLGETKRKDGTEQVTYAGHPLYAFADDREAGETNGEDVDEFGADWYAIAPSGERPEGS